MSHLQHFIYIISNTFSDDLLEEHVKMYLQITNCKIKSTDIENPNVGVINSGIRLMIA
jgi:hypothetical protein